MATKTVTVMGAKLPEDNPPMQAPPRPRQTSNPRVETEWDNEPSEPTAAETPQARKLSPPGGIKLEGPGGWKLKVPQVALVALLAGGGGAGAAATVAGGGDTKELIEEQRALRQDIAELRKETREERRAGREADQALLTYTRESVTLLAQTMRELGAKVEPAKGALPPLDMHPAPLRGSEAPHIQPRATLPAPPELGP